MMRARVLGANVLAIALLVGCRSGGDGDGGGGGPTDVPRPVPTIGAISPARVCRGGSFTLVVTGTNYSGQSVVRVNGVARATTVVSETELRTAIAPADLSGASPVITVATGTTVGTTSATLAVDATSPTTMSGAPTGGVAAGQATFTLPIDGTAFNANTVGTWNGVPRPTKLVRPTRLVVTIDAQDVASPGQFTVGVVDTTNQCAAGAGLPFTVSAAGAPAVSNLKALETWATAMLWHAGRQRLLVASRSGELTRGYLFAVDPVSGRATDSIFIDPEPGRMTMTDDGKYLFIEAQAFDSPGVVKRVQISPFMILSQFTVAGDVWDLAAMPGSSTSVAVSGSGGIAIYDNGVARPATALGYWVSLAFGDATRLYAYADNTPAALSTNIVSASGVQKTSDEEGGFTGTSTYLEHHAGRLYLSSGYVFDAEATDKVLGYIGRSPTDWDVKSGDALAVDDRRGRAYEIHNGTLTAWDLNTFQALGKVKAAPAPLYPPPANFWSRAVRWGSDGLAFNDVGFLYMFRSTLVVP